MPLSASETLGRAAELAEQLGIMELKLLIDSEILFQAHPKVRILFLGPTSSGKTSTLCSLIPESLFDGDGRSLLPIGVKPATSQIIEVNPNAQEYRLSYADKQGGVREFTQFKDIRTILCQEKPDAKWAFLDTPSTSLPSSLLFVDTPGVAADKGEYANGMVEEALAISDKYLFHIRARRGVGPALELLSRIKDIYPYKDGFKDRFVLVLTDSKRGSGRIKEIVSAVEIALKLTDINIIKIPGPNQNNEVLELVQDTAKASTTPKKLAERTCHILEHVILPACTVELRDRKAIISYLNESKEHIEEFVRRAEGVISRLNESTCNCHKKMLKGVINRLDHHEKALSRELQTFIDGIEQSVWKEYWEQLPTTFESYLKTECIPDIKDYVVKEIRSLQEEQERFLQEFEQQIELVCAKMQNPEFSGTQDQFFKSIPGAATRGFFHHLVNMGGKGGIHLGTINFARKRVAEAYRLFGKRAPSKLIRKGIPEVVKPLGKMFKFLEKKVWIVDLVVELSILAIGYLAAKSKMHKQVNKLVKAWREGYKPGMFGKIRKVTPEPGWDEQLTKHVDEIFMDEKNGMFAQVKSVENTMKKTIQMWQKDIVVNAG